MKLEYNFCIFESTYNFNYLNFEITMISFLRVNKFELSSYFLIVDTLQFCHMTLRIRYHVS